MRKIFFAIIAMIIFKSLSVFPADSAQRSSLLDDDDMFHDFGWVDGLTIEAERLSISDEDYIIRILNSSLYERRRFIAEDFLEGSGFRRTANMRFRRISREEKARSVLHGAVELTGLGIIPTKPFFEVEYEELPRGEFYHFESVIYQSRFRNIPQAVRTSLELEYMLQVWFHNGTVIESWNSNYYTEEHIANFERLALSLPNSPESMRLLRDRYLNTELLKLRAALHHRLNL